MPSDPARLSAGTTTLVFAGPERQLVGIDAYTNWERWGRGRLHLPHAAPTRLLSLSTFDEGGIAAGPARDPAYRYDPDQALLAITIADGDARAAYRCLTCAVAELDGNGRLLTVYIEGLQIAPPTPVPDHAD